ncbi:MAG: PCMD domain-containing protein [Paludibacteraceae bacterium]|nr:PCMD domain-containing protein [Paludibacteraceae bacterium]
MKKINVFVLFMICACSSMMAQETERVELIPFGDFEQWVVRKIKESDVFSGKVKKIYAIGPTDTILGAKPFYYGQNGNPWSVSNAYIRVLGLDKVSGTTRPERRDSGWCARMDCKLEPVVALSIDLKVQIAGTIFLGWTYEPIPLKAANDPYGVVDFGVPFTGHPKALQLDYKAKVADENVVTYAKAVANPKLREGRDCAEIYVYLQRRWEEKGKIYAERVATGYERIWNDIPEWVNDHRIPIRYGDITQQPDYQDYEGLNQHKFRTKNSKGDMVYVNEVGYSDAEPTHMVLMISSGRYEAFIGHDGNVLWVDNVALVY